MQVYVKDFSGREITIANLAPKNSIKYLKRRIYERLNISPDNQRLIYIVTKLEDEKKTISDYGIVPDATLHLVIRVPGGGLKDLLSSTRICPNNFDWQVCLKNSTLMSKQFKLSEVIEMRADTWEVVCEAFNIDDAIKEEITDNSADPVIRLLDTIHYLYHQSHWWH